MSCRRRRRPFRPPAPSASPEMSLAYTVLRAFSQASAIKTSTCRPRTAVSSYSRLGPQACRAGSRARTPDPGPGTARPGRPLPRALRVPGPTPVARPARSGGSQRHGCQQRAGRRRRSGCFGHPRRGARSEKPISSSHGSDCRDFRARRASSRWAQSAESRASRPSRGGLEEMIENRIGQKLIRFGTLMKQHQDRDRSNLIKEV